MATGNERKSVRKLTTIVFVDIVGYTKIMQVNEASALEKLDLLKGVIRRAISSHNGSLIQYFGDGSLLSFDSATDAVKAAMSIQIESRSCQIPLRIGIHLGEVTYLDNNVFGDGVNIASRIETIGSPGSILLSKATRDQIKNKDDFVLKEVGAFRFKNVEERIRVFAIANESFKVPNAKSVEGKLEKQSNYFLSPIKIGVVLVGALFFLLQVQGKLNFSSNMTEDPSIAMIPFEMLEGDQHGFLIRGLESEMQNQLSRMSGLRVISRRSTRDYDPEQKSVKEIGNDLNATFLLMGEVQIRDIIKIDCQIINSLDQEEIWANTFVGHLDSLIEIQSIIIKEISDQFQSQDAQKSLIHEDVMSTTNLEAYLQYSKGLDSQHRFDKSLATEDLDSAIEHYEKALEIDSLFAKAMVGIAQAIWDRDFEDHFYEKSVLDNVIRLCNSALKLDPYIDEAYYIRSRCYLAESRFTEHKNDLLYALDLNPNFADALRLIGEFSFRVEGNYDLGLEYLKKALERSHGGELAEILNQFCWLYLELGMFDRAIEFGLEEKRIRTWSTALFWTYLHQGSFDEAYKEAIEYGEKFPDRIQGVWHLAISTLYLNRYEESKQYFTKLLKLFSQRGRDHRLNRYRHRFGYLLTREGHVEEGLTHFRESVKFLEEGDELNRSRARDNNAYNLAAIAAFLGDRATAYKWLDKMTQFGWHWGYPFHIRRDPMFKSLMQEKRFNDIVEKALNDKSTIRIKLISDDI